ncbi:CRAL-TRIO domain-containing protein, partial [Coemansia mojavensis]
MVNEWYQWRKDARIDDLPIAQASNTFPVPYAIRGYHSVADANLTAGMRVSDMQLKLNKVTMNGLFEFHFMMQEFLNRTIFPECSEMAGCEISKQVVIFDMAGISIGMLSHWPALNMLREMLSKDQLYYPECMHLTYIVNAPSMFVTAWKLIRSWLDPRVISKIHILGKDHADVLLKQIPDYNLPAFLGGSCRCSHMPGGCVPS